MTGIDHILDEVDALTDEQLKTALRFLVGYDPRAVASAISWIRRRDRKAASRRLGRSMVLAVALVVGISGACSEDCEEGDQGEIDCSEWAAADQGEKHR